MNKHSAHMSALLSLLLFNWISLIADIVLSHQDKILNVKAASKVKAKFQKSKEVFFLLFYLVIVKLFLRGEV